MADAQTAGRWHIGMGVDAGIPTKNPFQYALGGDVRLQKELSSHLAATLTAGFTHYFEKDHFAGYNEYGSPFNVIPVKAGLKYFFTDGVYVGGEAGGGFGFEQWKNSFLWSPSIGIEFKNGIDVSLKYEDYTRNPVTKDVALRLGYAFDTRKMASHKRTAPLNDWEMSISIDPGFSINTSNASLGTEVTAYKRLTDALQFTVSAGYTYFFKRSNNYYFGYNSPVTFFNFGAKSVIPVKAGLRYYTGDKFYIAGAAGIAIASQGNPSFVCSPSAGFTLKNGLDLGVSYSNFGNTLVPDVAEIKVAYKFKLK